jgi:hypothetical protein
VSIWPRYPTLYEINTCVWLSELSQKTGTLVDLSSVPATEWDQHPAIESGSCRVRVMSFVGAALQLELFAYGKTGDWAQFTVIREDVLLKIADIVEASGTRFAGAYPIDVSIERRGHPYKQGEWRYGRMTELRASDSFRVPRDNRAGTQCPPPQMHFVKKGSPADFRAHVKALTKQAMTVSI